VAEPRGAKFRTQFRFELGGTKYEYKGYLSAADALLIKANTGLTALSLFTALPMGDPGAMVALVFLAKRQAGERVTWDDVVAQIDGDDDLWALLDTLEPITAPEEPAQTVAPEQAPVEEPEPAVA
jgi:hypothetical protein